MPKMEQNITDVIKMILENSGQTGGTAAPNKESNTGSGKDDETVRERVLKRAKWFLGFEGGTLGPDAIRRQEIGKSLEKEAREGSPDTFAPLKKASRVLGPLRAFNDYRTAIPDTDIKPISHPEKPKYDKIFNKPKQGQTGTNESMRYDKIQNMVMLHLIEQQIVNGPSIEDQIAKETRSLASDRISSRSRNSSSNSFVESPERPTMPDGRPNRAEEARLRKQKEEEKFITRWNNDDEIKRLGLDTNNLSQDPLRRAKEIHREAMRRVYERAAESKKRFDAEYASGDETTLGGRARIERAKLVGRELKLDGPASQEQVDAFTKKERDAMDQARAIDRMTPGQRQGMRDREVENRIAKWEAGQRQNMLNRIGARTPAGAEYVAAEAQARAAEENLRNVIANQKSEAEIRKQARAERDATEVEVRASNPPAYSTASQEEYDKANDVVQKTADAIVKQSKTERPKTDAIVPGLRGQPITMQEPERQRQVSTEIPHGSIVGQTINYMDKMLTQAQKQSSQTTQQPSPEPVGKYEMWDEKTGKIVRSDAPGGYRVWTDNKGRKYRETGKGRVYVK